MLRNQDKLQLFGALARVPLYLFYLIKLRVEQVATLPLEMEKLLAVCWLILTGLLRTASRALIEFVYGL